MKKLITILFLFALSIAAFTQENVIVIHAQHMSFREYDEKIQDYGDWDEWSDVGSDNDKLLITIVETGNFVKQVSINNRNKNKYTIASTSDYITNTDDMDEDNHYTEIRMFGVCMETGRDDIMLRCKIFYDDVIHFYIYYPKNYIVIYQGVHFN